jgi:hypothetical protein
VVEIKIEFIMEGSLVKVVEEELLYLRPKAFMAMANKFALDFSDQEDEEEALVPESPLKKRQKRSRFFMETIDALLKQTSQDTLARAMLDAEWNTITVVAADNLKVAKKNKLL